MARQRKISPNIHLNEKIVEYTRQLYGTTSAQHMERLWERRYQDFDDHQDLMPYLLGNVENKERQSHPRIIGSWKHAVNVECQACCEEQAEYAMPSGRAFVCWECAETWTKVTGEEEWYSLPKALNL
jgi:ribosomal protein S27E